MILFIYVREKERELTGTHSGGGTEGKGERISDSLLSMEPNSGLDLMTLRSGPELKAGVRCLND